MSRRPLTRPITTQSLPAIVYLLALLPPLAVVVHLVAMRPYVGSVDFFYYVTYARDMLSDQGLASQNCYKYFPGVYAFWRWVITIFGGSLESLQWRYLGVLILNGLLVAAIIYRGSGRLSWSWLGLFWYIVSAERFQGFAGTTGPIATLPLLIAVLLWAGRPISGERGWNYLLVLGAGIGLSLYCRQQAGLLAVGAAALLCCCHLRSPGESQRGTHHLGYLALLPVLSGAVFVLAVLTEAQGLSIIWQALDTVAQYSTRQSPPLNYYVILRTDEVSILAFAAATVVWLLLAICRPGERAWFHLSGFCLLGAVATMVQFWVRPYGHYMLIGLPFFVIGTTLILGHYFTAALQQAKLSWPKKTLLVVLVILPLVNVGRRSGSIQLWRLWPPQASVLARSQWHLQPEIKEDLRRLRQFVTAGESMYVYPPRHNSPYFITGGRGIAETGYGFIDPQIEALPFEKLKWVLLIESGQDAFDRSEFKATEQLRATVQQRGFRIVARLRTMSLWGK